MSTFPSSRVRRSTAIPCVPDAPIRTALSKNKAMTRKSPGFTAISATRKSSRRPTSRSPILIGDLDPIKAAREKRDFSDAEIINYGIIPRTNRGIFAINELPDLQPRIQVGLLNILEECDLQIRGFPIRIPLDLVLVFTANPEDYTIAATSSRP